MRGRCPASAHRRPSHARPWTSRYSTFPPAMPLIYEMVGAIVPTCSPACRMRTASECSAHGARHVEDRDPMNYRASKFVDGGRLAALELG